MSKGAKTTGTQGFKPQHTFVAMLFALSAASVATSAADVALLMGKEDEILSLLPAISHVVLTLLVISMSWIEWSRSIDPLSEKNPFETIVQWRFLLLLLDVGLVVLYFLLAREIETKEVFVNIAGESEARTILSDPSSAGEIKWSLYILFGYLLYDIAADVFQNETKRKWMRNAFVGCFASIVALGAVFLIKVLVPPDPTAASVVLTDMALVAVFAGFRLLKGLEFFAAGLCKVDKVHFRKRDEFQKWAVVAWVLFIVVALTGFGLCGRASCQPPTDTSTQGFTMPTYSDTRPVVYIASPYSKGDPAINTHFQCSVFDRLMNDGRVLPIAPLWSHFQHTLFPRPYKDWVSYDLALLERYDACLRLAAEIPGLGYAESESSGADGEVRTFQELGKPVFRSIEDLYKWVDSLDDRANAIDPPSA